MNNAKKKCNRTTTRHARPNRAHLLGTLVIGAIGSSSNGQLVTPDSQSDLLLQRSTIIQETLVNANSYDFVLKAMLNAILQLLDEIIETRPTDSVFFTLSGTLSETSTSLVDSYDTYGLDPALTASEISAGIIDCDDSLNILKDPTITLSLTQAQQDELHDTLVLINGELNASF